MVSPRPGWRQAFEQEAERLSSELGSNLVRVHHISSTAIPGIYAKPMIDFLLEVESLDGIDGCNRAMQALGYVPMGEFGILVSLLGVCAIATYAIRSNGSVSLALTVAVNHEWWHWCCDRRQAEDRDRQCLAGQTLGNSGFGIAAGKHWLEVDESATDSA